MATKIQPLGPRVLIKRLDEQEESAGGIIIPDTAKEKPQEAEVVGLGDTDAAEGTDPHHTHPDLAFFSLWL